MYKIGHILISNETVVIIESIPERVTSFSSYNGRKSTQNQPKIILSEGLKHEITNISTPSGMFYLMYNKDHNITFNVQRDNLSYYFRPISMPSNKIWNQLNET